MKYYTCEVMNKLFFSTGRYDAFITEADNCAAQLEAAGKTEVLSAFVASDTKWMFSSHLFFVVSKINYVPKWPRFKN